MTGQNHAIHSYPSILSQWKICSKSSIQHRDGKSTVMGTMYAQINISDV